MAIDDEKVFARVETNYLMLLLQKYSFGPCFLYAAPRAQLFVNNLSSDDFRLSRGTRQGCPLSLILFALSLLLLAEAILAHPQITGVQVPSQIQKLSLCG